MTNNRWIIRIEIRRNRFDPDDSDSNMVIKLFTFDGSRDGAKCAAENLYYQFDDACLLELYPLNEWWDSNSTKHIFN